MVKIYSKKEFFMKLNEDVIQDFIENLENNPPISDNSENSEFGSL